MIDRHPDPATLARFGGAEVSRSQGRDIVRHLLKGCERCRDAAARILPFGMRRAGPSEAEHYDYQPAFDAASKWTAQRQMEFAQELAAVGNLWRELEGQPLDRQLLVVKNSARHRTWALTSSVVDRCHDLGFKDPARAVEVGRLGVALAESLSVGRYGEFRVTDLIARAWATLANAQRVRSDFRESAESFARAESLLKRGSGDALEKAWILLLKSSLRGDQGRYQDAAKLLDRVVAIARREEDTRLMGKALIKRGVFESAEGRTDAAIESLSQGIPLVEGAEDARLLVAARHNLAVCLVGAGHLREASALIESTRPLYAELGDRMNLIRLRWLEGNLAREEGYLTRAEGLYREVESELIERGLGYDVALLGLDLADVFLRQGRTAELRPLAARLIPSFQAFEVRREAIAALIVFRNAVDMERATLGLVRELGSYLRQCQSTEGLRLTESV